MLNLHRKNLKKTPDMQISPMIDMIFLLLVFFIISTMYMTQVKTVALQLPQGQNSTTQKSLSHTVSIKADNSLWLDNKNVTLAVLTKSLAGELAQKTNISVVIRADKRTNYGHVMQVLDSLKGAGVTKFALATESGK